jgi:hypothetical protein
MLSDHGGQGNKSTGLTKVLKTNIYYAIIIYS